MGEWRKYVHGVANRRIEDGCRTEQNSCGGPEQGGLVLGESNASCRLRSAGDVQCCRVVVATN